MIPRSCRCRKINKKRFAAELKQLMKGMGLSTSGAKTPPPPPPVKTNPAVRTEEERRDLKQQLRGHMASSSDSSSGSESEGKSEGNGDSTPKQQTEEPYRVGRIILAKDCDNPRAVRVCAWCDVYRANTVAHQPAHSYLAPVAGR